MRSITLERKKPQPKSINNLNPVPLFSFSKLFRLSHHLVIVVPCIICQVTCSLCFYIETGAFEQNARGIFLYIKIRIK